MKPKTVDEYISNFSGNQMQKLAELRHVIRSVLSDTDEMLKWGAPASVEKDGMILVVFSGHKDHINLVVTPSTKQAFADEINNYETSKGAIRLHYDDPLPTALIKKIVLYRAKEYREHGVKWK